MWNEVSRLNRFVPYLYFVYSLLLFGFLVLMLACLLYFDPVGV